MPNNAAGGTTLEPDFLQNFRTFSPEVKKAKKMKQETRSDLTLTGARSRCRWTVPIIFHHKQEGPSKYIQFI